MLNECACHLLGLLVLVGTFGCNSGVRATEAPGAESVAALPAPRKTPWETAMLAVSDATAPAPTAGLPIIVSLTAITLGDGTPIAPLPAGADQVHGVDAAYKRAGPNDLFIVPLANAVNGAHEARIAVDPRIPYRVLVEVLFTLGQSEVSVHHLMVKSPSGVSTIDPILPHAPSKSDVTSGSLGLTVLVVTDGISIKARGGNVAPGCADVGPGLTVPKKDGAYDRLELARCALVVKMSSPAFASERRVVVAASPNIDFQTLVSVMDALRGSFPDVMFGLAR